MADHPKILIVDDDIEMGLFFNNVLKEGGFEPVIASDWIEGINKARQMVPDLIIVDAMMPNQGGLLMYKKLNEDAALKRIPLIWVSLLSRRTFTTLLKTRGMHCRKSEFKPEAYLQKPPETEELLSTISDLLALAHTAFHIESSTDLGLKQKNCQTDFKCPHKDGGCS